MLAEKTLFWPSVGEVDVHSLQPNNSIYLSSNIVSSVSKLYSFIFNSTKVSMLLTYVQKGSQLLALKILKTNVRRLAGVLELSLRMRMAPRRKLTP
jgi:hypothetical protein